MRTLTPPKFIETLGATLAKEWIAKVFTPAFVFWFGGGLAWASKQNWATLDIFLTQKAIALLLSQLIIGLLDELSEAEASALIKHTNPRTWDILILCYGLDDGQKKTLAKIGQIFNISQEHVQEIAEKALQDLRSSRRATSLQNVLERIQLSESIGRDQLEVLKVAMQSGQLIIATGNRSVAIRGSVD